MLDSSTSSEAWSARYEQLRSGWFDQDVTWGQALLIRQGMAAWMKAWPASEPSQSAGRLGAFAPKPQRSQPVTIDGEVQRQLTCELANLILHRQQKVLA